MSHALCAKFFALGQNSSIHLRARSHWLPKKLGFASVALSGMPQSNTINRAFRRLFLE
jgi:hypothetical protein